MPTPEKLSNLKKGIGFYIDSDGVHRLAGTDNLSLMLTADFKRKDEREPLEVFDYKYLKLTIKNYPQKVYVGYVDKAFQAGYRGEIKDAVVTLKLKEASSFFEMILKDNIEIAFDTFLAYDLQKGLSMGGDVQLRLDFDLNHKKIGPATFERFTLLSGVDLENGGTLNFDVLSSFKVDFSAITFAFEDLGLGFGLNFLKKDGTLGDWDFDARFCFPTAVGIMVNCPAVTGGGFISYDSKTAELIGAIELSIINKFGVSALVLCNLGSRPGKSFSLVTLLSVSFKPGIPLGMGFSLTKIGGALGLNRMLDREGIVQGVRNGTLESVFFVENIKDHLAEMKTSVLAYFPEKKGQFFVGLLARISYEPIVDVNFGLLLQLPKPVEVIIVGALHVAIKGAESIMELNVCFAGGINFAEGIWFDASIINSHIVGIQLFGDVAFRLFWGGKTKGFLLSLGGFHPAYTPEKGMMVSGMKRLGMQLDYKILKISFQKYMAITSNTFQIGSRMDMLIGWDRFGISGYAGFDCLFQFDPFMFIFDLYAGMVVKAGSVKLLSINLALGVSGPQPWRVKGSAKFWVLFVPIKVSFDLTWGDEAKSLPEKTVEVYPLLLTELKNPRNWTVIENLLTDNQVNFGELEQNGERIVLQPYDQISFNQSAIPFCDKEAGSGSEPLQKMELYNSMVPIDFDAIKLSGISINGNAIEFESEYADFAPSLFKNLSLQQKLKSPSYMQWRSGFILSQMSRRKIPNTESCTERKIEYEVKIKNPVDSPYRNITGERNVVSRNNLRDGLNRSMGYARRDMVSFNRHLAILDNRKSNQLKNILESIPQL